MDMQFNIFVVGYLCLLPIISVYTDGLIKEMLLYLHAIILSCLILEHGTDSTTGRNEIYGLRHILFNLELPPKTLWFNMGLWNKPNLTFSQACENLVHAVMDFIDIKPVSTVLDVGFGCGDSCILLAEHYKSKVTGITNELSQWKIASNRTSNLKNEITLIHGSADDLGQHISTKNFYDYIISIDSAYHYNTRWDFLKNAMDYLKPNGGIIGLYDLCIDPDFIKNASSIQLAILKSICMAVHVPLTNLVTPEEYENKLVEIGYKNVQMVTLERAEVFGGLSKSFGAQYDTIMKYGVGVSIANRIYIKLSNFFFGLLGTKPWLVPVMIKGEKA